ncbi:MAG: O-methyltransferase [Firmicutes bacterium]|nr:O-methyltransferase [Bacillota bacterium]
MNEFLTNLKQYATENNVPILQDDARRFIEQLIILKQPKTILEIGSAIGYSGIVMLKVAKNAHLTTIEKNEERVSIAKESFEKAGFSEKVNLIHDDARLTLEELASKENPQKFDFIFLDGPKGQYSNYFPFIKNLLADGGVLVADNVMLGTSGIKKLSNVQLIKKRQAFVDQIMNDPELASSIVPICDILSLSVKI